MNEPMKIDRYIYGSLGATAFFIPWDKMVELPLSLEIADLTSLLGIGMLIFRAFLSNRVSRPPVWLLVLASWLFLALLSGFQAESFGSSIRRIISYSILITITVLASKVNTKARTQMIVWYLRGCLMMVVTMIYMLLTGQLGGDGRIEPPNQDANEAATHLVIGVLCSFWLYENREKSSRHLLALLFDLVVMIGGIGLTGSRGAIFTLIVVIAVLVTVFRRGRRVLFATTPVVAIAAIALLPPFLLTRITGFASDAAEGKLSKRDIVWKTVISRWERQPWLGIGPANLAADEANRQQSFFAFVAHNTLLEILAEHGVIGLTPFVGFLLLLYWKIIVEAKLGAPRLDCALAFGSLSAILVAGLSLSLNNGELLWLVFGLTVGLGNEGL